jgi:4-amino-4-deoxy-L-arabinose transferase-like glycosyltransferase
MEIMATLPLADDESDDDAFDSPRRFGPWKQFGLTILCAAWVLLGIFGHDPWKTQDALSFGVALDMIERGDGLAPRIAGEPHLDNPPLAYWLAAGTALALSPPLSLHDAARVAAALVLALTLLLLAATATELEGSRYRWTTVLLFVGSVGLWERAHQLSPELVLMLAVAAAQYGLALAPRVPLAGGALLGVGCGIAFLSAGLNGPVWLAITAFALPIASAEWRTRRYAAAATVAIVIAILLMAAWPLALYFRAPMHLAAWWATQTPGDFLWPLDRASTGDPTFLLKNLTWFAWPALPLVVWTLVTRGRGFNGGLATPGVELPGVLALVMCISIAMMGDPRLLLLLPLLVPLSLLAALEIDTLKRGYSGALDWFGILTFGMLSVLMWWLWFDAYTHGMMPAIARLFRDTEAGYRPSFQWLPFCISVFLTVLWALLVRPARRSNRRAVLNWTVGMTLLWGLYSTIWTPYLDSRRSYRAVAESLRTALPREGCVASRGLGDAQRVLFKYFADLVTVRAEIAPTDMCNTLLVQQSRNDRERPIPDGWHSVWTGRRHGDDTERYTLYVRKAP